jgi:hypothetical protein
MRLSHTAIAGLIAVAAVSGCGASRSVGHAAHGVRNAVDAVAEASTTTQRQNTAEIRIASQGTVNGQRVSSHGSGVIQFRPSRARLSMSASAGGQTATLDEVMDGTTIYLHVPKNARAGLPSGKSWIKIDLDRFSGGALRGAMSQQQDPTATLKLMRQTTDVRVVGRERLNGVGTTHYRGTIDYARLARSGPASVRKLAAQALRLSARPRVPLDVWIDGAKRVRRERIVVATKAIGQSPPQTQTMTIDFVRFGVDASAIAPPAAGDVYDATGAATRALNSG